MNKQLQYIIKNAVDKYLQIIGTSFAWIDKEYYATKFTLENAKLIKEFTNNIYNYDVTIINAPLRFVLKKFEDDSILYYFNTFKQMNDSYRISWTETKEEAQQFDENYAIDMAKALRLICGHHITSEQITI